MLTAQPQQDDEAHMQTQPETGFNQDAKPDEVCPGIEKLMNRDK